jgi:hypothetical protein
VVRKTPLDIFLQGQPGICTRSNRKQVFKSTAAAPQHIHG